MKVIDTYPIEADKYDFTTLLLSDDTPLGKWEHVRCGREHYSLVWMSGGHLDEVTIKGIHPELKGQEVVFE